MTEWKTALVSHTCCPSRGFPWWRCVLGCSGPSRRTPHRTCLYPEPPCCRSHWSHRRTVERNEDGMNGNAVTESRSNGGAVRNFTVVAEERNAKNWENRCFIQRLLAWKHKSRILRINTKLNIKGFYYLYINIYNTKLNMTLCHRNVSVHEN